MRSGSSCSFMCALAVAGFLRVHLVGAGELWRSLGSIRFIWFVGVRPGGHWIVPGSSGSSGRVAGVIRVRKDAL